MKLLNFLTKNTIVLFFIFSSPLTAVEFSFSEDPVPVSEVLVDCNIGETWVKNHIKYECTNAEGSGDDAIIGRAVGCSPDNILSGPIILPDQTYTNDHFKYSCSIEGDDVVLKVLNCIDNEGNPVKIGDWFTKEVNNNRTTIECHGDEQSAKKVIFKWTSCLIDGEHVIEGNFRVKYAQDLNKVYKNDLQIGEIISCKRENGIVEAKCTGCVGKNNIHVSIAGYSKIGEQWTQCRRHIDECKLVNVGKHYVDCTFNGVSYAAGEYFNATNGIASYTCINGFIKKQGCWIGDEFKRIGEVFYENDTPFVCDFNSDSYVSFGNHKGCLSQNGNQNVKFGDTWREGNVMKRCSWEVNDGEVSFPKVEEYACVYFEKVVPLNKIIRDEINKNILKKCALNENGSLSMRTLTESEMAKWLKKKTYNLDLLEFYGKGGRGPRAHASPTVTTDAFIEMKNMVRNGGMETNDNVMEEEKCIDKISICRDLKPLCSSSSTEKQISEIVNVIKKKAKTFSDSELFTQLISKLDGKISTTLKSQTSCDSRLSALVDIICPITCNSCYCIDKVKSYVPLIMGKNQQQHCL
uniref:Abnormal cell migration protein 18-like fibronectin type I domain-containing protein n=1 Tax=Strongyloides papillosus TaxID=174720 RepID=A0A0N5C0M3_STREA